MQKIHNAPTLQDGNMTPVRAQDHQMKHKCMKCLLYVGITSYFRSFASDIIRWQKRQILDLI